MWLDIVAMTALSCPLTLLSATSEAGPGRNLLAPRSVTDPPPHIQHAGNKIAKRIKIEDMEASERVKQFISL
jgi:hypothetical protein